MKSKIFILVIIIYLVLTIPPVYSADSNDNPTIDNVISNMKLEEKIGQMFMLEFPGTKISNELQALIKSYHLGGVILYKANIESIEQLVSLTDGIQKSAGKLPLFISTDQEGGSVKRLPISTTMPGNMALGAGNSKELTYKVGKTIGKELLSLGINCNLAPVLDLISDIHNQEIGIRSFGSDPKLVSDLGGEYIKGLNAANVISTAKHFPGHGGTNFDTHLYLPVISKDISRLKAFELKPFQKAIASGVDMIMPAHIAYPALDNSMVLSSLGGKKITLPATLSYKILTGLLRKEMGYKGVIISDAFDMKAVADYFKVEDSAVLAVNAGVDILLMHNGFEEAYQSVINAVKAGNISIGRINEAVSRILLLKQKKGLIKIVNNQIVNNYNIYDSIGAKISNAKLLVNSAENRKIEKSASEEAVTLLNKNGNPISLNIQKVKTVSLFAPSDTVLDYLQNSLIKIGYNIKETSNKIYKFNYDGQNDLFAYQKNSIETSDIIIICSKLGTPDYNVNNRESRIAVPIIINKYAISHKKITINISAGLPLEPLLTPDINNIYAVYGYNECNIEAGINSVFLSGKVKGKLPIDLY